jgi:hypothetical protein
MPRLIETDTEDAIELGELIERLETGPFDPDDEDAFVSWGPALKALGNNRKFLADLVIQELKERCRGQTRENQYSPQVIMLYGKSGRFVLRANFWPAMSDSVVQSSGTAPFFYGVPHDHNFSFLTVGYLGPGYWSDYYEYEYGDVTGFAGEEVALRFVERSRLEQGKVLLYRAHRDIHNQLPADALSVSLNILATWTSDQYRDQYRFHLERGRVDGHVNRMGIEPLIKLAAHFGGEDGRDLLDSYAAGHPSDRVRFMAVRATASTAEGLDARIAAFEQAARLPNRYVAEMARREAGSLEIGRPWLSVEHLDRAQPA